MWRSVEAKLARWRVMTSMVIWGAVLEARLYGDSK